MSDAAAELTDLRAENAALKKELAAMKAKMLEAACVILLYAGELRETAQSPLPTTPPDA